MSSNNTFYGYENWSKAIKALSENKDNPIPVRCFDDCYWTRQDWGDQYTPPSCECGKDEKEFEDLNLDPCYSEQDNVECPVCPFYLNRDTIDKMAAEYHYYEEIKEEQ